jgi:signal transduction histidine kinase
MIPALATESEKDSQENVLRAIAHEIRQPLSTIESIAYYLSLTIPDNEQHCEHLSRVQQLVEQSNWILSNGLALADSRPPEPKVIDIGELIAQTVAARPAPPSLSDPPLECDFAADRPFVLLDPTYGRALIENILGLFRQLATEAHPAHLRIGAGPGGVEIDISCIVPGYRSMESLPPGSVLSIDCARHVATMHGGSCHLSIDPVSGIRLRVMLP